MAERAGNLSTELGVTWKIRNFFRIPAKVNSRVESRSFSLAGSDWRLELYPNGRSQYSSEEYIDIHLARLKFSVAQQIMHATFSIKNRDGESCRSFGQNYFYGKNLDRRGVIRFIARSLLEKNHYSLLPDDTLTVHCQIIMEPSSDDSGESEDKSSQTDSSVERIETGASPRLHLDASSQTESSGACKGDGDLQSVQKLQTDYKKLLESKEDADVCLKVCDKEFRAHKCILRARSSIFSAMFEHDMEEKTSGKVVIKDMDPESFQDLLQHIYSGSVDELSEENMFNLFTAADKYGLTDLTSECKKFMKSILSVDTFCEVMIVAFTYREDDLLKLAIDFFAKNFKKIIVTVKWQKFLKEYDTQANELLIKALVTDDDE